jgi:protease-4
MANDMKRSRGVFGTIWRGIDSARRILLNLLFLAILMAILAVWWMQEPLEVPSRAALVINPKGDIVEQLSGESAQRAIRQAMGVAETETLLRDLIEAIELAETDDRIQTLFLNLNGMGSAGLTKLQDLGTSIESFKESGKKVVAVADGYQQWPYYLAATADEVYMDPMGYLILEGFGRFRTYYKEGLDRLEVDYNVFRVGEYKSAVEPFLRNDMSEEAREANLEWLGDLWNAYLDDVSEARGMTSEELSGIVNGYDKFIHQAEGNIAQAAFDAGLVDGLMERNGIRQRMIELVGEDEETHSFHQIDFRSYLDLMESERREDEGENVVAVVVAKGSILDGSQPPGNIGGDSTAALIKKARQDDKVKAIVLRVDSGGGSAFASEVIRREFVLAREADKPVVVSMGTVAASGGYWISTASDEIWAHPSTITGSIGIFGMFPTFQRTMSTYLGINVDGVGTTPVAGALRVDRKMEPRFAELFQLAIEQGYRDFLERVAEAREMTVEEVDEIARGRVWSGQDAFDQGLIDQLGGLDAAIVSAAEHAKLGDDYSIRYVEKKPKWYRQYLMEMIVAVANWAGPIDSQSGGILESIAQNLLPEEFNILQQFNDPRGIYAACLCEVE